MTAPLLQRNPETNATLVENAGGHAAEEMEEAREDMMELGHPVRYLKSPSGEPHRVLLS